MFHYFLVSKNSWIRGGREGLSRLSVENLLSHSAEKLRRGTLLCFRNIVVSKTNRYKRGGYHNVLSKLLSLTVPKNFIGEPFGVSEKFGYRNSHKKKREVISKFSVAVISFKNVGKGWDSNPYLSPQNLVVLPTVPWELLELLTIVREIIKTFGTTETRTRPYLSITQLSYPLFQGNFCIGVSDKCQ